MLLSMTGFGEARRQNDGLAVAVEVRTINSRYFKLSVRCGEGYSSLEPQIEALVRDRIKRGTVQVSMRIDRAVSADDYRLNKNVLAGYRRQLEDLLVDWQVPGSVPIHSLLQLPGVVDESRLGNHLEEPQWQTIEETLIAAMNNLQKMREEEGRAMATDLRANCRGIGTELEKIAVRAPVVVDAYRARLEERLKKTLAEFDLQLNAADIIREVSIYAERSDISEEIVRLRSHLEQFETIMQLSESSGRKLEFLTQEMFRETNTIGSKSTDVDIARYVIEIKAAIERVREMIQNVE